MADTVEGPATLALNTTLEEAFILPLTAVRGSLELLRDHPDMTADERTRFVNMALRSCAQLERGVEQLAVAVYGAAGGAARATADNGCEDDPRIRFDGRNETIEIDLSGFVFSNAAVVDRFFDRLEARILATGRKWYFLINHHHCSVWPEAWVAFAFRSKRASVAHAIATVRFVETGDADEVDVEDAHWRAVDATMYSSRAAAVAHICKLRGGAD